LPAEAWILSPGERIRVARLAVPFFLEKKGRSAGEMQERGKDVAKTEFFVRLFYVSG